MEGKQTDDDKLTFEAAPERNPGKYGTRARQNQVKASQLTEEFFKSSFKRAKEQKFRQDQLDERLSQPTLPEVRARMFARLGILEGQHLRHLRTPNRVEDFEKIQSIGRGSFGHVNLVRRKETGKVYALKSLLKSQTIAQDLAARVRSERDILVESDSPWLVKLFMTFQDADHLHMLMEFVPGGDLMAMLIKFHTFTVDITRFYMAEIVVAIDAVHSLGFIHRDIKPDNILLDRLGHIKLTDFGLSTGLRKLHTTSYYQQLLDAAGPMPSTEEVSSNDDDNNLLLNFPAGQQQLYCPPITNASYFDQISMTASDRARQIDNWRRSRRVLAYSAVGTPDYTAPELVLRTGYDFSIDLWSLGVVMYECLLGFPPFCAENARATYRKIKHWPQCLAFPRKKPLDDDAEHLIRSLVCNVEARLPTAQVVKLHPFFRGVDWGDLRRLRAPFEPTLSSEIDCAYFPPEQELDQTARQMAPVVAAATAATAAMARTTLEAAPAAPTAPTVAATYTAMAALPPMVVSSTNKAHNARQQHQQQEQQQLQQELQQWQQEQQQLQLQEEQETRENPEMTLPFIGYTFKRFENNFQ